MRAKIVELIPQFIAEFVKTTEEPITISVKGVPADAKFLNAFYDHRKRVFCMVFEHDSFEDLPDGIEFMRERVTHTIHDDYISMYEAL